jgi:putative oxidoreductase
MDAALLVGRILLAVVFIHNGIDKFLNLDGAVGYIQSAAPVLPQPMVLAVLSGVLELLGGILIVIGWQTRAVAAVMLIYTGVLIYFFHAFWAMPADAPGMVTQMIHAEKNLAIIGGFFLLAAAGAGSISVDGRKAAAMV